MVRRRWRKGLGILWICLGLLLLCASYTQLGDVVVDYAIWRWMVTFKRPIEQVDDYRVVVTKSTRRLDVYQDGQIVASYRVGLSSQGLAPRKTWEDRLTPEGVFLIASMQRQSVFGPRQMLLETTESALEDYLAQYGDAGRARLQTWENEHRLLDTIWETYDFNAAYPEHPMWHDILIHGGGSERDWTWGCIALDDADVVALFDLLHKSRHRGLGVPVEIRP
jgi:hypothetical protein